MHCRLNLLCHEAGPGCLFRGGCSGPGPLDRSGTRSPAIGPLWSRGRVALPSERAPRTRWHQWFGIHGSRVSKVLAAVAGALGGQADFEHKMVDYSKVNGAANSLSADVRASIAEYLLDRTRVDPEKKQVSPP
eukprot:2753669-Prymnesium_polylepis.2